MKLIFTDQLNTFQWMYQLHKLAYTVYIRNATITTSVSSNPIPSSILCLYLACIFIIFHVYTIDYKNIYCSAYKYTGQSFVLYWYICARNNRRDWTFLHFQHHLDDIKTFWRLGRFRGERLYLLAESHRRGYLAACEKAVHSVTLFWLPYFEPRHVYQLKHHALVLLKPRSLGIAHSVDTRNDLNCKTRLEKRKE
jgi:hypothetical protein